MSTDTDALVRRLQASADEVAEFPHPSFCDHLHDASAVMREAADTIERLTRERQMLRTALRGVLDPYHEGQVTVREEASGYVQAAVEAGEEALRGSE